MSFASLVEDPLRFKQLCWPDVRLYDKQVEILYSLRDNDETVVPAGNQLGKDFITAFAVLWFFCSRSPCRIVTSSSGQTQLKSVLWGEMANFIHTSRFPLPIQINDMRIRQTLADGGIVPKSYILGVVTNTPENLLGHHLDRDGKPRTLMVYDEGSGIDNAFYDITETWSHRRLIIGNPWPCENYFKRAVKEGDLFSPDKQTCYRKVIKIKAADSPNVRLAEAQIAAGQVPDAKIIIPGVIDYKTYRKRRETWDKIKQCIGLDGEFYEGAETLLYPPDWLNKAEDIAAALDRLYGPSNRLDARQLVLAGFTVLLPKRRVGKALGIDAAEGGDSSVWTVVDELGILEQLSLKTSNTNDIPGLTIMLGTKWDVPPESWLFDRGGGGQQHADRLRAQGYNVRTVGFGEAATDPIMRRRKGLDERQEETENRYVFKNRRAEMYGLLRFNLLDPVNHHYGLGDRWLGGGFGIPAELTELRRQLAPMPMLWDNEGRLYLPPKDKPSPSYSGITIKELLGRSPDEADSLMLAVFGMLYPQKTRVLSAL